VPELASIFGQDSAVRALQHALEADSLAGTYLLTGVRGVGKGALARAFAQAACCLNPASGPADSCGECASCRRADSGSQPEIVTIAPAGEWLLIGQFWDREGKPGTGALSRSLNYAPVIGRRRAFIVERAETLTESAANSLLKVLEEPPPYVLFILLASHTARVLPTIVSRSQVLRVQPAPVDALARYLSESHGVDPDRAALLAAVAEGRVGQAVTLARSPAVSTEIEQVLDFAESIPGAPPVRALRIAEQMRKLAAQIKALTALDQDTAQERDPASPDRAGRVQLAALFDLLLGFYRDLLAVRVGGQAAERIVNRNRLERLEALAQLGDPPRWMAALDAILLARRRLDANANVALVTESLAMSLLGVGAAAERV
jgi:DNA polymerase-3 subunit delta'